MIKTIIERLKVITKDLENLNITGEQAEAVLGLSSKIGQQVMPVFLAYNESLGKKVEVKYVGIGETNKKKVKKTLH